MRERKIFAAFEWNIFTRRMYESILKKIAKKYAWEIQYGPKKILQVDEDWKKEIKLEDIEEFIERNKQLYNIFVKGISSCDLFIADVTNNNPNVLLELGIAIQQDKNILVVTSRDVRDLPFDIRGIEAKRYTSEGKLQALIENQIKIYEVITKQNFKPGEFVPKKSYKSKQKGILINNDSVMISDIPKLKNLRIKVDFRFIFSTNKEYDWFGISLRTQGPNNYNAELALVRYSGATRSLTWPGPREENDGEIIEDFNPEEPHTFEVLIEENNLTGWIDNKVVLEDSKVIKENFGEVWIGSLDHHIRLENPEQSGKENFLEVEYSNIQILDLSTTSNIFEDE